MRAHTLVAIAWVAQSACAEAPRTTALFDPDDPDDFYALPFPSDVRREPDGTIDLSRFPTGSLLVDIYRQAADQLDGFGLNSAIYARFDGPLDPSSLPSPAASRDPGASVYLVDIDPMSPANGTRVPIIAKFRAAPTSTLGDNHLVVRPFPGFGLADGTTYALVVTERVRGADGAPVVASRRFEQVLAGADLVEPHRLLLDHLAATGERAVSAAVFTTQHATFLAPALRNAIAALPPPQATSVTSPGGNAMFTTFVGTYTAPNFQAGDPPYRAAGSGAIAVDDAGIALVARMEAMRFGLTVPTGAVPTGGFPLVIYSHGTGGDHLSFVDDGTALALAQRGLAVISTDQVLHGPRNPNGDPQLDFFNFQNPLAMRDNSLQGSADAWSQLRLAEQLSIADGGRTITFDTTRTYFFGHSQGGLTGPAFVAFEPKLAGAVFSGTGGLLYLALLYKTAPVNIPELVETVVRDDPMDEDNPSLAMIQMWIERADGANYAALMNRGPLPPRNVFQLEGFTDTFTPNPAIEAFATALGADIVMTPDTTPLDGIALRERSIVAPPVSNNVNGVTTVLAQYAQRQGSDGHFVVFDIAAATRQAAEFLATLATTGTATVVGPQ